MSKARSRSLVRKLSHVEKGEIEFPLSNNLNSFRKWHKTVQAKLGCIKQ